jgi:hypothetical protein
VGTATVESFQWTLNQCFATVIEDILGRTVKAEVFELLMRNGIRPSEISSRFDDVVNVLTTAFGEGARLLVFKTVTELYKEYSQRTGFTFGESMTRQISSLRERAVRDLLKPRSEPLADESIQIVSGNHYPG